MTDHDKKNILFLDDERFFLDGIRRILNPQRNIWQITYLESGIEALEELRRNDYDVIVTDITMPTMTGFEFLSELRKLERAGNVPVIVLTGNRESHLKRRALELGATDLLTKPVHPEDLIARLRSALRTKGYQDQIKAYSLNLEAKVRERTAALESSRRDIIWRLAKAGEFRDEETGNHVVRVSCYCRTMAHHMGMDEVFVESLFLASPLHDIGKIGIPDGILLKQGQLTADERELMKKHCEFGAKILSERPRGMAQYLAWRGLVGEALPVTDNNPVIEMAVQIALCHHERWDGAGYPRQLKGEEIPTEARIVSLADVYDALCSKRPYKQAFLEPQVQEIIKAGRGSQFDPSVYDSFIDCLVEIHEIQAHLSD
jgi:putative two-component system response regulator